MSKFICLNHRCGAVFEDDDIATAVIDRHPYGEGTAPEYGSVCPLCGSPEIAEAFQCSACEGYFPIEERRRHPTEEKELCYDCYKDLGKVDESPYSGISDMFGIIPAMVGGEA